MTSVERLLVAALPAALGAPVVAEVTDPRPDLFVRVVAAGGPPVADVALDVAEVAWEAWGPTRAAADNLAASLRAAITNLQGTAQSGVFILEASCGRGRWFPDASGAPRYVGAASLTFHHIT